MGVYATRVHPCNLDTTYSPISAFKTPNLTIYSHKKTLSATGANRA